MHVALIALPLILLFSNPVYNIDRVSAQYKMTVSVTGWPASVSYEIGMDIVVSPSGFADVDLDLGNIPANWSDDIPAGMISLFILSKNEIDNRSIEGEDMDMQIGTETDPYSRYFGASILIYAEGVPGDYMRVKWNVATGIILSLHIEITEGGENINIDVEYQSSDVNIYGDQNVFQQFGNQLVSFIMTPLGFVVVIILAAIAVALGIIAAKSGKKPTGRARRK